MVQLKVKIITWPAVTKQLSYMAQELLHLSDSRSYKNWDCILQTLYFAYPQQTKPQKQLPFLVQRQITERQFDASDKKKYDGTHNIFSALQAYTFIKSSLKVAAA